MYKSYGMQTNALNLKKTDKILLEGDKVGNPYVIDMGTYHKAFDDDVNKQLDKEKKRNKKQPPT